jgi:hypothetical protein
VLFISGYPADMPPHPERVRYVRVASKPFRSDELRVRLRALIDAQPAGEREGPGTAPEDRSGRPLLTLCDHEPR